MRVLENVKQGTTEWHLWRASGIGATEAAAANNVSRYETPLTIYNKKVNGFDPSAITAPEVNSVLWAGHFVEDMLLAMFKSIHPEATGMEHGNLYEHDQYDWAHASLDGECDINGEHVIVECKSIHNGKEWEYGKAPAAYVVQVLWQMFVTGYRKAVIVGCYLDGRTEHYTERWVEWDESKAKEIFADALALWKCIINKTSPALSAVNPNLDRDLITAQSTSDKANEIVEIAEDELEYLQTLKDQMDSAKTALDAFKVKLLERCKDGQALGFNGKKVGYWVNKKGSLSADLKTLQAKFPEAYKECVRQGNGTKYFTFK